MLFSRRSDGGDLLEDETALPRRGPGTVVRELGRGSIEDGVLGESGGGAVLVVVSRGLDMPGRSLALAAHHHHAPGLWTTPARPEGRREDVSCVGSGGKVQVLSDQVTRLARRRSYRRAE